MILHKLHTQTFFFAQKQTLEKKLFKGRKKEMLTFTSGHAEPRHIFEMSSMIGDGQVVKDVVAQNSWIALSGFYKTITELKRLNRIVAYISVQFMCWPHSNAEFELSLIRLPALEEGKASIATLPVASISKLVTVPIVFGQQLATFTFNDPESNNPASPLSAGRRDSSRTEVRNTWEIMRCIDIDLLLQKNDRVGVMIMHQGAPLYGWTASISCT